MDYVKKLFKKLVPFGASAKNKANKPAALMALAGVILVTGVILGALNMNGKTKQDAATAQPTAHHKTAQKTASGQPAATTSPEPTGDATDSSEPTATDAKKSSSATAAPKSSAASTSKKTTTPAEPTVYPHVDPDKIKQYATQPTNTNDQQVTSVSVTPNNTCGITGYHWDIHFLGRAKAAVMLSAQWEVVSGSGAVPAFSGFSVGTGVVEMYDTLQSGFYPTGSPYTVRLHITAPNDMYSNTMTITSCS